MDTDSRAANARPIERLVASSDGSRLLVPDIEMDEAKRLYSTVAPALQSLGQPRGLSFNRFRSLPLTLSNGPRRWTILELPLEKRGPEEYARLLRCRAPWRLPAGRLVSSTPPADCLP